MNKILTVAKPYCWMEPGEKFELSSDGKMYTNVHTNEYTATYEDADMSSKAEISYSISKDFANSLVENGFLKDGDDVKDSFKNVFDEIDTMIETYKADLRNLDEDMENEPACMKVEKETVLHNLIKTLSYLKSLKK